MVKRNYKFVQKRKLLGSGIPTEEYEHKNNAISVFLTKTALYFEASGGDATMDALMDASELRKKMSLDDNMDSIYVKQFAVYDPYDGWL